MQPRSIGTAFVALGAFVVAVGISLAFLFGGGAILFRTGQRIIAPASYWSDEALKLEGQLQTLGRELDQCREKIRQSDLEAPQIYANFVKQGASPEQAKGLTSAWQSGVHISCNYQIDKMILIVKSHAEAKSELRKHSE